VALDDLLKIKSGTSLLELNSIKHVTDLSDWLCWALDHICYEKSDPVIKHPYSCDWIASQYGASFCPLEATKVHNTTLLSAYCFYDFWPARQFSSTKCSKPSRQTNLSDHGKQIIQSSFPVLWCTSQGFHVSETFVSL
jgi:hypothetical protein